MQRSWSSCSDQPADPDQPADSDTSRLVSRQLGFARVIQRGTGSCKFLQQILLAAAAELIYVNWPKSFPKEYCALEKLGAFKVLHLEEDASLINSICFTTTDYYIAHHHTIFQKCITLPNGILQNVMLHFYASFRRLFQESTASMQGHFFKLRSFRSTTASIKTLWQKMLRFLEGECPIMFKELATLVNGWLQKVMLHYNSFLDIFLF